VEPDIAFAAGLRRAVEELPAPAYFIDRRRRLRWLNLAGRELLGDQIGQLFCRVVAREDVSTARNQLARRILGEASKDVFLTFIDREGQRVRAHLVSVPVTVEGEIVGLFGLVCGVPGARHETRRQSGAGERAELLTPRQLEVLRLLAQGLETSEIAARLGVVEHTARNHMRGLFRELGVHSRLQAVLRGYQVGLLDTEELVPMRP
jgi:DNA-binding CsgD family transcriptional regulator